MRIKLTRFAHFNQGTLGKLEIPDGPVLYTIEKPWKNNEPFVSCIPTGMYPLEWDTTGRIKNVPRLRNTNPRTQINIHVANYANEVHGCIAPGTAWGMEGSTPKVLNSKAAMGLLLEFFPGRYTLRDGEALTQDGWQIVLDIRDFNSGGVV